MKNNKVVAIRSAEDNWHKGKYALEQAKKLEEELDELEASKFLLLFQKNLYLKRAKEHLKSSALDGNYRAINSLVKNFKIAKVRQLGVSNG